MNPKFDLDNSENVDVNQAKSYQNSYVNDNSTNISGGKTNINNGTQTTKFGLNINPLIIVVAILVLIGGSFGIYKAFGGGSSLDSQLVGTWEGKKYTLTGSFSYAETYIFNSNHTLLVNDSNGEYKGELKWEINDSNNLILSYQGNSIVTYVWDDSLVNGLSLYDNCWYLSGDVLYIGSVCFDRK